MRPRPGERQTAPARRIQYSGDVPGRVVGIGHGVPGRVLHGGQQPGGGECANDSVRLSERPGAVRVVGQLLVDTQRRHERAGGEFAESVLATRWVGDQHVARTVGVNREAAIQLRRPALAEGVAQLWIERVIRAHHGDVRADSGQRRRRSASQRVVAAEWGRRRARPARQVARLIDL